MIERIDISILRDGVEHNYNIGAVQNNNTVTTEDLNQVTAWLESFGIGDHYTDPEPTLPNIEDDPNFLPSKDAEDINQYDTTDQLRITPSDNPGTEVVDIDATQAIRKKSTWRAGS